MITRLLTLTLALWLTACGGGYSDATIPAPATLRTDLSFGYFGAYDNQARDTKGAVNLFWESDFQGTAKAIDNITTAGVPTVLSCAPQLFEQFQPSGINQRVKATATQDLRAYFQALHDGGALQYVKALVPIDEPNINASNADLRASVTILKSVAAEFPELAGVKLAIIYAYKPFNYDAIELFDYVGIDDYGQGSGLLINGSYAQLKVRLRPDQRTILVPGGAFGEPPTEWVNFAESNAEVGAIVAFVWFPAPRPQDVGAIAGHPWVGIGFGPLRDAYLAAGRTVVGAHL